MLATFYTPFQVVNWICSDLKTSSVVVVYSLFVVAPIKCGFCVGFLFCGVAFSVLSSYAIILLRKIEELVALL